MGHFEKLLESSCTHHATPVRHFLKDCKLTKKFFHVCIKPNGSKKKDDPQLVLTALQGQTLPGHQTRTHHLWELASCESKRQQKIVFHDIYTIELTILLHLMWSMSAITFDCGITLTTSHSRIVRILSLSIPSLGKVVASNEGIDGWR